MPFCRESTATDTDATTVITGSHSKDGSSGLWHGLSASFMDSRPRPVDPTSRVTHINETSLAELALPIDRCNGSARPRVMMPGRVSKIEIEVNGLERLPVDPRRLARCWGRVGFRQSQLQGSPRSGDVSLPSHGLEKGTLLGLSMYCL